MQGIKQRTSKLFCQFRLEDHICPDHPLRRIDQQLDLRFLYKQTRNDYGNKGQKSIDPVVFFKACLLGYFNNIVSDRALIRFCNDSLSARWFIGYDIDQALPVHSTLSRTRVLCGEQVYEKIFTSKTGFKQLKHSPGKPWYDLMDEHLRTAYGKHMLRKRKAIVEPALWNLLDPNGMKKVYARGIRAANKHVLLASMPMNLKKWLKDGTNTPKKKPVAVAARLRAVDLLNLKQMYWYAAAIFDQIVQKKASQLLIVPKSSIHI